MSRPRAATDSSVLLSLTPGKENHLKLVYFMVRYGTNHLRDFFNRCWRRKVGDSPPTGQQVLAMGRNTSIALWNAVITKGSTTVSDVIASKDPTQWDSVTILNVLEADALPLISRVSYPGSENTSDQTTWDAIRTIHGLWNVVFRSNKPLEVQNDKFESILLNLRIAFQSLGVPREWVEEDLQKCRSFDVIAKQARLIGYMFSFCITPSANMSVNMGESMLVNSPPQAIPVQAQLPVQLQPQAQVQVPQQVRFMSDGSEPVAVQPSTPPVHPATQSRVRITSDHSDASVESVGALGPVISVTSSPVAAAGDEFDHPKAHSHRHRRPHRGSMVDDELAAKLARRRQASESTESVESAVKAFKADDNEKPKPKTEPAPEPVPKAKAPVLTPTQTASNVHCEENRKLLVSVGDLACLCVIEKVNPDTQMSVDFYTRAHDLEKVISIPVETPLRDVRGWLSHHFGVGTIIPAFYTLMFTLTALSMSDSNANVLRGPEDVDRAVMRVRSALDIVTKETRRAGSVFFGSNPLSDAMVTELDALLSTLENENENEEAPRMLVSDECDLCTRIVQSVAKI